MFTCRCVNLCNMPLLRRVGLLFITYFSSRAFSKPRFERMSELLEAVADKKLSGASGTLTSSTVMNWIA